MKYISPGSWFSIELPDGWSEYEDTEDTFLFCNSAVWDGNFRISASRGETSGYARDCMEREQADVWDAKRVKVGRWNCIHSASTFQDNDTWYTTHFWVTGQEDVSINCSFTVKKGGSAKVAEAIIATLRIHGRNERPWREIIPARVVELQQVDEACEWAVKTVKKLLGKEFEVDYAHLPLLQQLIDKALFKPTQRDAWEKIGIAFGAILYYESGIWEWMAAIDGDKAKPMLCLKEIDYGFAPGDIVWNCIRHNHPCNLDDEIGRIAAEVDKRSV